jgi:hypothetical protein
MRAYVRVVPWIVVVSLVLGATDFGLRAQETGANNDWSSAPREGQVGVGYEFQFCAARRQAPYKWSLLEGGLPKGIKLDPDSGLLYGTPREWREVPYTFTVRITDASGASAEGKYSIKISPAPLRLLNPQPVLITISNPSSEAARSATPVRRSLIRPAEGCSPPAPPTIKVNPRAGDTGIQGQALPSARITVTIDGEEAVGAKSWVNNADGKFKITLTSALAAGEKITLRQTIEENGEECPSEASPEVTVLPSVPVPIVEQPLQEGKKKIAGRASPQATVEVSVNGETQTETATGDAGGVFELTLRDTFKEGHSIKVRQVTEGGTSEWSPNLPVEKECSLEDCRGSIEATAYTGLAIDTFAAGELQAFLNPDESGKVGERLIAGFEFGYRIFGDATHPPTPWKPQLWVFGETVHGARSADLNCEENKTLQVCDPFFDDTTGNIIDSKLQGRTLFLLRNATSLEGFVGLRYEFLRLQPGSDFPTNAYFKTQYGFLTVARNTGDVVDLHQYAALGLVATTGKFQDSYLEVGFGRTDLFHTKSKDRWKLDGMITWEIKNVPLLKSIYPFVQITVDADFGSGSDSIQSYIGLAFDIDKLFRLGGTE